MSAPIGPAVNRVGAALRDRGSRIDSHGGYWMVQCPAHEDRTASLSLAQGDVGAVLCCQAGCETRVILDALKLEWGDLFDEPRKAREKSPRRVVAEYRYTDERGELLFVKVRYEPKDFRVKRQDGHGGWIWSIGNTPRVLYRLPEVLAAIRDGKTIYLVEGEKDADRLAVLGHVATCNFDGAAKDGQRAKWQPKYGAMLRGADVVVIADRDAPGIAHAHAAAADLAGKAKSVCIVQPAIDRNHADVSDHLDAGLRLDQLARVQADSQPAASKGEEEKGRGPSAATMVARYAQERYTFHRDEYDEPYALPKDGPRIARYLRGARSLRAELARIYLLEQEKPANSAALADALGAIEGLALLGNVRETYMRTARHGEGVYLDLGSDDASAAHVGPGAWEILREAPVVWRCTRKTRQLPEPIRGGSFSELWAIARVPENERPLVAAWQVCALLDMITPVLNVIGEHGSGKTSAAKAIAGAIDTARPGTVPSNAVDLVVGAHARHITILDNLTHIQPWLADALCRLVTGDELDRRMLFTDSDVATLSLHRPVMTTSIDTGAVPPDYADRRVNVHVPVLDESQGMSESQWGARWDAAQPRIMGAVLGLASAVLARLPGVTLDRIPRMGDYARVLAAVDEVMGTEGLAEYRRQRVQASAESVTSDPVGPCLMAWAGEQKKKVGGWPWRGSMQELLELISPSEAPKDWPKSPRGLAARLAKLGPDLRKLGIDAADTGDQDPVTRRTIWQIKDTGARSFGSFKASEQATDQQERTEGSPEGSPGPERDPSETAAPKDPGADLDDPSQSFGQDTPFDLRFEGSKDLKLCAPTLQNSQASADDRLPSCQACGEPMKVIEPGQQTHPMCGTAGEDSAA